jgi:galactokinase
MRDRARADAPGRINLIGEHTDYHQGFVLPTIIPQRTAVELERRADRRVHAVSAAMADREHEYELGAESPTRSWIDYVQGVTLLLAQCGIEVPGFNAHIESAIPPGAGVSSSAALAVSLLRALRVLVGFDLDDVTLARIARRVETDFVGAPVGIMDQVASSLGTAGAALFLDTRSLATELVPMPATIEIAAIDSGIPHEHAGGLYAARRRESFEAAARLGVTWLRDLTLADLPRINTLPDVLARRARHVVTENARVLESVLALKRSDAKRLGELFNQSHASMRDDYDISLPDIDRLVTIAVRTPSVYGARLTGGGFGGAVVVLIRAGEAATAALSICADYSRETGRHGHVLVPTARQ